jgi:hypothetical protein
MKPTATEMQSFADHVLCFSQRRRSAPFTAVSVAGTGENREAHMDSISRIHFDLTLPASLFLARAAGWQWLASQSYLN